MRLSPRLPLALLLTLGAGGLSAQAPARSVPRFPVPDGPLTLEGPARPGAYVASVGRRAALFGDEQGAFEAWTWPIKLVRDLRLDFKVPEYDDPISGASVARTVTVRPEGPTITYSQASFTVREHLLTPLDEPGALILLEVETVRPLEILVRMHADFQLAWPGSFGGGYITWVEDRHAFQLSQGGLHLYNALVGSPFATGGTSHPAHDAPMLPSQFLLRFEPGEAQRGFIPIVLAGGAMPDDSVQAVYDRLLAEAPRLWKEKVAHYRALREDRLSVTSPDPALDRAIEWAKVNLDQQEVCNPDLGCGLVAGFGVAGPGNFRPGFGWYFGGDAAINTLAMDGLGQLPLVREGLTFLGRYQREDGKIPHEISHAAGRLPWFTEYPYTWFHGDTTPFWILACYRYWRASGDTGFLRETWPKLLRAYRWSAATDTDGDGLMENPTAGAGAIEVGGLGEDLHTDIYLAGVWTASLGGMEEMARAMGQEKLAREAAARLARARRSLEDRFWMEEPGIYAFALLGKPGKVTLNDALTIWPATALSFGLLDPARADRMLSALASSAITTDWGTRTLAEGHPLYDPLHYNNGTVWPFVTGFAALAQYRYHRPWDGLPLVEAVAQTTFDFARGHNPELLSGAFYRPLDTAVPHQFFATSMLASPYLRGLLGLDADAPACSLAFEPHLPPRWDSVTVRHVDAGCATVDLRLRREAGRVLVSARRTSGDRPLTLRVAPALPLGARVERVVVDGVPTALREEPSAHDTHAVATATLGPGAATEVEIAYRGGAEVIPPESRLRVGQRSDALRILDFRREGDDFLVRVEGRPGTEHRFAVRSDAPLSSLRGAEVAARDGAIATLSVRLPAGAGDAARAEVRW